MRLYLVRESGAVPADALASVAPQLEAALGVTPGVVSHTLGEVDPDAVLDACARSLDADGPSVLLIFTVRQQSERVLGAGVQRNRGIPVTYFRDQGRTLREALHRLSHVFEAGHCTDRNCLMFPYPVPRWTGARLTELLCASCRETVTRSWVYRRLRAPGPPRRAAASGAVHACAARPALSPCPPPGQETRKTFPDWSLPDEEIVRQAKEFYGYK